MDERVEAFLADVLALEGEDANAIREGVRVALADCEQIFRAQEVNRRMKEKAAHACHALCRTRVVEEIRLRKGTPTAEHLKLVLSVIDGARFNERFQLARAADRIPARHSALTSRAVSASADANCRSQSRRAMRTTIHRLSSQSYWPILQPSDFVRPQ